MWHESGDQKVANKVIKISTKVSQETIEDQARKKLVLKKVVSDGNEVAFRAVETSQKTLAVEKANSILGGTLTDLRKNAINEAVEASNRVRREVTKLNLNKGEVNQRVLKEVQSSLVRQNAFSTINDSALKEIAKSASGLDGLEFELAWKAIQKSK